MVRHQLLRERNYKTEKNGKKRCLTHKMNANKKINENKQTNKQKIHVTPTRTYIEKQMASCLS